MYAHKATRASILFVACIALLAASFNAQVAFAQGSDEFVSCGGFVKPSSAIQKTLKGSKLDVSALKIELLSPDGSSIRGEGVITPSGYWVLPVYDQGTFQIRVRSPAGWFFAPAEQTVSIANGKCNDEKDINFELTGFSLSGDIVSDKSCKTTTNVVGAQISLMLADGKVIATTSSSQTGAYVFENVAPGSYLVSARGGAKQRSAEVKMSPSKVSESLIVSKFEISGSVALESGSEKDAVSGVDIVLYGDKSVTSCSSSASAAPELPVGFKAPAEVSNLKVLCATKTDKSGLFKFTDMSCGTYTVVPFYKTASGPVFDVVPELASVEVDSRNAVLSESFRVKGFSVSGRVLVGSTGVSGVTVRLGDSMSTVSDAHGVYKFDQVEAGSYKLSAQKDKLTFSSPAAVKITLSTSRLPDIAVKTVELCGRVSIPHPPSGVEPTTTSSRQVNLAKASNPSKVIDTASTSVDAVSGQYCFSVEPGQSYVVSPVITEREKRAGLLLSSSSQTVKVETEPVANVNFAQSLLTVSGRVRCLTSPCDPSVAVTLQSAGDSSGDVVSTGLVADDLFVFQHVVPGAYVVSVEKADWCFEKQALQVQVKQSDVSDLELVQSGYKLTIRSSHDVNVEYSSAEDKKPNALFVRAREDASVCVANSGLYTVRVAQSCYSFTASNGKTVSDNTFQFSTDAGKALVLSAKSYRLSGVLELHTAADDVTVEIRSSADGSLLDVAPLKKVGSSEDGVSRFTYTHWVDLAAGGSDAVEVVPVSKHVFFYPKSIKASGSAAECPPTLATISGRPGAFVKGQIEPATSGVKVTVTGGDDVYEAVSDEKGRYRVGPLPDNVEYSVSASATGFYLRKEYNEAVSSKQSIVYNFRAMKLGHARVSILDSNGAPLAVSGVLISLSGGEGYRNNTVTGADGTLLFANLFPGDYYALPMLKEYSFAPSSGQAVSVEEGVQAEVQFRATRIAFSAFGSVRSLNGQSERALVIEAVSEDGAAVAQREEAITDESGSFRLRGLVPGRKYAIQLKAGANANERISHAVPAQLQVTVPSKSPADITNLVFIAYRRVSRQSVSGRVVIANASAALEGDVRASLTIQLIDPDTPNVVAKEFKLSRDLEAFDFVGLAPTKSGKWIIRVKSTLPTNSYNYKFEDMKIDASGPSTFFDVPLTVSVKVPGQEAPPSQVASLVFMILLGIFFFYRKEATTFVWKTLLKREGEFVLGESVENAFKNFQRWQQSRKGASAASRR